MTILDWVFIAIIIASMLVGAFRGFVKEAISLASLLVAVWAAFALAPAGEGLIEQWIGSPALRMWAARVAIFALVLMLGGLIGWGIARFLNQVGMSGLDRTLGLAFGFLRGAIVTGLIVIAGPYLELDRDTWWQDAKLMPFATSMANAVSIIAPKAFDYLKDEIVNTVPDDEPTDESATTTP